MVMQSFLDAGAAGHARFLEPIGEFAAFDHSPSSQSSDYSQDGCPSWVPSHDGSADWGEIWADPCWQSFMLSADCGNLPLSAWGACQQQQQQQQWATSFLSSEGSWSAMDPVAISLAAEMLLAKPTEVASPTGMKWTEAALDPEKPTAAASKSRSMGCSMGGSDTKLPSPVGSGRQRSKESASEASKKLPLVAGEGQSWEGSCQPPHLNQCLASSPIAQTDEQVPRLAYASSLGISSGGDTSSSFSSRCSTMEELPNCGGFSAQQRPQLHRNAAICSTGPHDTTTVMVRNIPSTVKQSSFVKELEETGFGGVFDFAYLPSAFNTGKNKGYAFVNFVSISAYGAFVKAWHGSRRFNARASEPALNVSAAALQGLERNIEKWDAPRMRRVRNPEYRPFVVKDGKPFEDEAVFGEYAHTMELAPAMLAISSSGFEFPGLEILPPPGLALQMGLSF